jgi:hypothetical protein
MMKRTYAILPALMVVGLVFASLFQASSLATAQEGQLHMPSEPQAGIGTGFTYQGKLTDGGVPADGDYDFQFILYDAASGGGQVGSTLTTEDSLVSDGLFTVGLDFGDVFDGTALWLEVGVREGSSTGAFTTLSPRQPLTPAPYAINADYLDGQDATVFSNAAHDHWGQLWSGSGTGLTLSGSDIGIWGNGNISGVRGQTDSADGHGVFGLATATSGLNDGVFGLSDSTTGIGVLGNANATSGFNYGVFGESSSTDGTGVHGEVSAASGTTFGMKGVSVSTSGTGVNGWATATSGTTYGVKGENWSTSGTGVKGTVAANTGTTYGVYGTSQSTGGTGVYGLADASSGSTKGVVGQSDSTSGQGVKGSATASSGTTYGVVGNNSSPDGYAGYFRNTSSGVGLYVQTDTGSGNIIEAASGFGELEFKVARDGTVYSDGGFTTPAADYAELLPAHMGLEPGDVLIIGPDGELTRSTAPAQTAVVGVYSTQPAFLAGADEDAAGSGDQVPLAVMGVVPVKVTAKNGPILPGDLLTSSSTAGHAMRAGVDPEPGTIIGKALEPWQAGIGIIKMLVMLR